MEDEGLITIYKDTYIKARDQLHLRLYTKCIISFFTLTLQPKLYKYTTMTQFEMTHLEVQHIISSCARSCTILSTEITQQGNIHYHFICCFEEKHHKVALINKLKKKRLLGFVNVSPDITCIQEANRALIYLFKDAKTTAKILHSENYKPEFIIVF